MELYVRVQQALARHRLACLLLEPSGPALSGQQLLHSVRALWSSAFKRVAAVAELLRQACLLPPTLESPTEDAPRFCAIYLTNSAAYVVAVLAALRMGLAFLPLDPSWPARRVQEVCCEAQPLAVVWAQPDVCGGHGPPAVTGCPVVQLPSLPVLLQQQARPAGEHAADDVPAETIHQQQLTSTHPKCSRQENRNGTGSGSSRSGAEDGSSSGAGTGGSDQAEGSSSDCCYLLFTSGSTGRPLGVLGNVRGVLNRCRWMQRALPFQPGNCVAFKTSPCFVDSVWEVFGPLLEGVPLLAVPRPTARDPVQLLRLLADQRVTHLSAVPTLWRALAASMRQLSSSSAAQSPPAPQLHLRLAVSSGEPLPPDLLAQLQQLLPSGCSIWNLYGSTEVAADCTACDCTRWQPLAADPARQLDSGEQQQQREQQRQEERAAGVPVGQPIDGAFVAVLSVSAAEAGADAEQEEAAAGAVASAVGAAAGGSSAGRAVLPAGVVGEVAVGGAVLAAGYLAAHPAAVAAQQRRFAEMPLHHLQAALKGGVPVAAAAGTLPAGLGEVNRVGSDSSTVRLFLTGDLGWMDEAGCLQLAGRRDLQVKISGVRVDLSEVEAVLAQHPSVAAAAARVRHLPAGPVLEAFVEEKEERAPGRGHANDAGSTAAVESLLQWCQERLPPAAVPQCVQVLPALPRSAGGKMQRSQLPLLEAELEGEAAAAAAATVQADSSQPGSKRQRIASPAAAAAAAVPEAAAVAAPSAHAPASRQRHVSEPEVSRAFAAALGHADFEATTSLFSIGGTSLTAAEIAGRVAGGSTDAVFRHPSVRSLTAYLNSSPAVGAAGGLAAVAAGAAGGLAAAAGAEAAAAAAAVAAGHGSALEEGHQQQAKPVLGAAAAALAKARRLIAENAGSGEQQAPPCPGTGPVLRLAWRAKLMQCVDAAPLMELTAAPAAPSPAGPAVAGRQLEQQQGQPPQQQQQQRQESELVASGSGSGARVFACSHGGDVCCIDRGSGQRLWHTVLPHRADAGLVLCYGPASETQPAAERPAQLRPPQSQPQQPQPQLQLHQQYVAAATNGGTLFFLDAASGRVAGSLSGGGGIRAPPACDPWLGLVWQPTHGRELLVAAAPGREAARLPCPAAVSAAVAFCVEQRLAFVCCLDGSLLAIREQERAGQQQAQQQAGKQEQQRAEQHEQQQAGQQAGQQGQQAGSHAICLRLRVAWQWRSAAPLFVPAVVAGSVVLAAAVDGSVTALNCHDGSQLWRAGVQGALFAPPLLLHPRQVLLVGSQAGQLAALDVRSGRQLAAAVELGGPITGLQKLPPLGAKAPTADENELEGEPQGEWQPELAVACFARGVVALLNLSSLLRRGTSSGNGGVQAGSCDSDAACIVLDAVQLPGDVFAAPAAGPGPGGGSASVAVGCRDDHVYCLLASASS